MGKLTVVGGIGAGVSRELSLERVQIGRDDGCELRLEGPGISRRHAEVVQSGFGYLLRDLGSMNGTFVNSERITEHQLRHGDRIDIAGLQLLFEEVEPAAPEGQPVVFDSEPLDGSSVQMPPGDLAAWVRSAVTAGAGTAGASRFERRLAVMQKLTRTAGLDETPESYLAAALEVVLPELMADAAVVFLADEETGRLRASVTRRSSRVISGGPIQVSSTVLAQAMKSSSAFIASDAARSLPSAASVKAQRIRSVLCVPLKTPRCLYGLFYADVRSMPGFYQAEDVGFVSAICAHLAVNIENLSQYRKTNEAHRKLKLATRQLVESEKLSVLGRMSSLVAHELRTPLQAATVAVELLREDVERLLPAESAAEPLEMAETLARSIRRCQQLSDNLLHYSRNHEVTKVPLNLRSPLEAAVRMIRVFLAKADVAIDLECPRELPPVLGCGAELEQVFLNLLRNAADAIDGPGRMSVLVTRGERTIEVAVCDTGCGISPEHLPRIFEELFTTKPIGHGTGLGLSLCKRTVEEHGGTIEVQSEPGKGTTMTVKLPICGA